VVLSDQGLRRFLKAYEQRMEQPYTHPIRQLQMPLRQCMLEQARQIAGRVLSGQGGYQGMGLPLMAAPIFYLLTYDISDDKRRRRSPRSWNRWATGCSTASSRPT
jgi:hypothetical protein